MVQAEQCPRVGLFRFKLQNKRKNSLLDQTHVDAGIEGEPTYVIDGAETLLGVKDDNMVYFLTNQALISGEIVDQGQARLRSPSFVK